MENYEFGDELMRNYNVNDLLGVIPMVFMAVFSVSLSLV